jgi:hypothetical protein
MNESKFVIAIRNRKLKVSQFNYQIELEEKTEITAKTQDGKLKIQNSE